MDKRASVKGGRSMGCEDEEVRGTRSETEVTKRFFHLLEG